MHPKIRVIVIPVAFVVLVTLCLTGFFLFGDLSVPRLSNVALPSIGVPGIKSVASEEHRLLHVPAPLNASLGFGKIFYISLPTYLHHPRVLICRRTDRQDHMSLAFSLTGLTPAEVTQSLFSVFKWIVDSRGKRGGYCTQRQAVYVWGYSSWASRDLACTRKRVESMSQLTFQCADR